MVVAPHLKIKAEHAHFTPVQAVEGPIISITSIVTITTTAAEYANRRRTAS